jgi:t-SNARE domain-containing protein 1
MKSISDTTTTLKKISAMTRGSSDKEAKLRGVKLTSDFQLAVQKFTDTQKLIVAKMKTTSPMSTGFTDSDDQKQSLVDAETAHQEQMQYHQQLEFEQGLMIERENRVKQIETDILDVNEIMRDLATLVVDQRATVGNIFLQ